MDPYIIYLPTRCSYIILDIANIFDVENEYVKIIINDKSNFIFLKFLLRHLKVKDIKLSSRSTGRT